MTDDEKTIILIFVSLVINAVSGGYKCNGFSSTSPHTEGYRGTTHHSEECCKVEHEGDPSGTVVHFSCEAGCCGDRDSQYCCTTSTSDDDPYVIGGSIAGVVAFGGLLALFLWIHRKCCRAEHEYSDHKKLLKEIYAAESLEELFVPAQQLVSAPGTIIHPLTNVSGPFYTMDGGPSYVMPDLDQLQAVPELPQPAQPAELVNNNDDDNEENWDTWDGFAADHVSASALAGMRSAGRGRDNPHYQGEGEEGAQGEDSLPYYYEHVDKYYQPPPEYEEVTK